MKTIRLFTILAIAVASMAVSAEAQRKRTTPRRTTTSAKKQPPASTAKPALTSVIILAKQEVSNQVYNTNLFIDKLGPIAQLIESIDADAKAGRATKTTITDNDSNKKRLIEAIRGLKAGLANLETDFRTKPDLKRFLPTIQGITDLGAQAEDSAIAGKFAAAKDPLRTASKKLSDTLATMP